jgi:hypothetical protein
METAQLDAKLHLVRQLEQQYQAQYEQLMLDKGAGVQQFNDLQLAALLEVSKSDLSAALADSWVARPSSNRIIRLVADDNLGTISTFDTTSTGPVKIKDGKAALILDDFVCNLTKTPDPDLTYRDIWPPGGNTTEKLTRVCR